VTATSSNTDLIADPVINPISNEGLVAHYTFSGNADDSSGNSNDGISNGVTFDSHVDGNHGESALFTDGAYLVLPSMSFGEEFTLSLQTRTTKSSQILVAKKPAASIDSMQVFLHNGRIHARVYSSNDVFLGRISSAIEPDSLDWQTITITYDGGTDASAIRIYLNATQIDEESEGDGQFTIFNDLNEITTVGAQNTLNGNIGNFEGHIDNLRIYNRALSAEDVHQLYQWETGKAELTFTPEPDQ
ncbi:MAG TPA: hypothetical protein DHW38_10400, partial [Planctomycetaceae bacterium]|nr:hypothetical protein [Planctomycetaceae bacterium]